MTWVKLDDDFPGHPKVIAAGERAAWLYVAALCHSARHLTDGFIRAGILRRLTTARAPDKLAEKLIEAGLWDRVDGGYQVHDYAEYQPSSDTIKQKRRANAERVRRHRAAKTGETDPDVTRFPSVTNALPLARATAGAGPGGVEPSASNGGEAVDARDDAPRSPLAAQVAEVVGVLRQVPRLHVDVVGVENAIAAWPGRDFMRAARTVVTWTTDPAFRVTHAAKLLGDALAKQPTPPEEAPLDERTKRRRRNHAALKQVQAEAAAQAAGA